MGGSWSFLRVKLSLQQPARVSGWCADAVLIAHLPVSGDS
jgi:hypothetical protein